VESMTRKPLLSGALPWPMLSIMPYSLCQSIGIML
jgi:hypothetical protein